MTAWLRPAEAAEQLRVNPKTLARWAREGLISERRTAGGHRRYSEDEVISLGPDAPTREDPLAGRVTIRQRALQDALAAIASVVVDDPANPSLLRAEQAVRGLLS